MYWGKVSLTSWLASLEKVGVREAGDWQKHRQEIDLFSFQHPFWASRSSDHLHLEEEVSV